jgi:hypothetical protein
MPVMRITNDMSMERITGFLNMAEVVNVPEYRKMAQ